MPSRGTDWRPTAAASAAQAREAERCRIARELHDDVGANLTALRLGLERVQRLADDCQMTQEAAALLEIATALDRSIDTITSGLRAPVTDEGLAASIGREVSRWTARSGIAVEYHVFGGEDIRVCRDTHLHLYRVTQECLQNVWKHAGATRVLVTISGSGRELRLTIADDGCGFSVGQKMARQRAGGFGLSSVCERIALLSGSVTIDSEEGRGTSVLITVPLPQPEQEQHLAINHQSRVNVPAPLEFARNTRMTRFRDPGDCAR